MQTNVTEPLAQEIRDDLIRLYGPLLTSRDLWKVLGYASPGAYRQARLRKRVSVPEFEIEGRSGHFALTIDVARWLAKQRMSNPQTHLPEEGEKDMT
ncbi:MAG: hypothetical protein WCT05_00010 [Lentisphaeria bacterium]